MNENSRMRFSDPASYIAVGPRIAKQYWAIPKTGSTEGVEANNFIINPK